MKQLTNVHCQCQGIVNATLARGKKRAAFVAGGIYLNPWTCPESRRTKYNDENNGQAQ
jgi:hypothetical protein